MTNLMRQTLKNDCSEHMRRYLIHSPLIHLHLMCLGKFDRHGRYAQLWDAFQYTLVRSGVTETTRNGTLPCAAFTQKEKGKCGG